MKNTQKQYVLHIPFNRTLTHINRIRLKYVETRENKGKIVVAAD